MPEMVFAGSRDAQKRQTRSRKMARNSQEIVGSRDQNGRGFIMNTLPWRHGKFEKKLQKYYFAL